MDDMGDLLLDLVNAEGASPNEPDCTVEFLRLDHPLLQDHIPATITVVPA